LNWDGPGQVYLNNVVQTNDSQPATQAIPSGLRREKSGAPHRGRP
jgi:hypothetical protein